MTRRGEGIGEAGPLRGRGRKEGKRIKGERKRMEGKCMETDHRHWLKLEAADLRSLYCHQRNTYEKHVYISAQLYLAVHVSAASMIQSRR